MTESMEQAEDTRGIERGGHEQIVKAILEAADERDVGVRQSGSDVSAGLFAIATAVEKLTEALSGNDVI